MRRCPFCAEEVQDAAVKCRHCGSVLLPAGEPLDRDLTRLADPKPAPSDTVDCTGNLHSSGAGGDLLEVMLAFQQGHRDAFDALHQAIWSPVCLRAARMGLRADEAEEIAQKVLVRVFLYCSKTEFHHVAQVWAWVYTITVREVYKHWRRRRPELVSEEGLESLQRQAVTTDDDPATAATAAEALRAVDECIGRLGEAERLYLLGPLVQGLTFRQAAALHGLTLGQFKHRYEQALEAVRACMESKGHDLGPNPRTGGRRDD